MIQKSGSRFSGKRVVRIELQRDRGSRGEARPGFRFTQPGLRLLKLQGDFRPRGVYWATWGALIALVSVLWIGAPPEILSSSQAQTREAGPPTEIIRFDLLGPDWDKVPNDDYGVMPEKVVTELDIPKEYLGDIGARQTAANE